MTDLEYSSSSINQTTVYIDPYIQSPLMETIIISYSLTFFFGFLGNLLVIFVIARNRSMHTVTNFFLANLAVADLFVSMFCTIPKLLWFVSSSWEYGDFLCKFHNYAMSVTTTSSIFILTVISMERFIAILRPLETRRLLTAGRLTVAMATVWIASVLFNIHTMWYYRVSEDGIPYCIPSVKMTSPHVKIQTVAFFFIYYVIPLMVMVILYGLIGHKLWVSSKLRLTASDREKPERDRPKRNLLTRLAGVRDLFKRRNQTPAPSFDGQKQANNGGNVAAGHQAQGPPGTFEEAQVLLQTQVSTKSEENPETQKIGPFFLDEPEEDSGQTSPAVDQACIYKPKGGPDHEVSIRIDLAGNKKEETQETTLTETRNGPAGNDAFKVMNNNQAKASDAAKISKPRRPFSPARPLTISKSEKSKPKKSKKKETVAARKKVIKLLVVVVSSFALCLLPYQIVALVLPFGSIQVPPVLNPMIYLCYFFNSALNPFLYAFLSDNFRKRMRETLTLRSSTRQRRWKQTQWRMRSMTEATETETMYTSS